jgi:hypothetical protein
MVQSFQIPPSDVECYNTLHDSRGALALRLGCHEMVTVLPDGSSKVFKLYEYVALDDGRLITAITLAAGKIELAICDLCRYPLPLLWWRRWLGFMPEAPSVGVMARESGFTCAGCSHFVCRRHARVVGDGSVCCIPCAQQYWWRALLHSILYAPVRKDR